MYSESTDLRVKCIDPDFANYAKPFNSNTKFVMFQVVDTRSTFVVEYPHDHPFKKDEPYTFKAIVRH